VQPGTTVRQRIVCAGAVTNAARAGPVAGARKPFGEGSLTEKLNAVFADHAAALRRCRRLGAALRQPVKPDGVSVAGWAFQQLLSRLQETLRNAVNGN
ncbi:hypothetical protein CSUI_011225, partial [Cystoisospora suis]